MSLVLSKRLIKGLHEYTMKGLEEVSKLPSDSFTIMSRMRSGIKGQDLFTKETEGQTHLNYLWLHDYQCKLIHIRGWLYKNKKDHQSSISGTFGKASTKSSQWHLETRCFKAIQNFYSLSVSLTEMTASALTYGLIQWWCSSDDNTRTSSDGSLRFWWWKRKWLTLRIRKKMLRKRKGQSFKTKLLKCHLPYHSLKTPMKIADPIDKLSWLDIKAPLYPAMYFCVLICVPDIPFFSALGILIWIQLAPIIRSILHLLQQPQHPRSYTAMLLLLWANMAWCPSVTLWRIWFSWDIL